MTNDTPVSPPHVTVDGSVSRIIFHDAQSGFSILIIEHTSGKSFTATGAFPFIMRGHMVRITGKWIQHPKFGRQFEASSFITKMPSTRTGLITFLSSGFVKGVGEQLAEKLVDTFGNNLFTIIAEQPHKLGSIVGLGPKRIAALEDAWREQKEFAHLLVFLQGKGLSATYAAKLYKQYKHQTVTILTENPYKMIDDIWGIGFTIADDIAQKMGTETQSPVRIAAGIRHALRIAGQQGHLYVPEAKLINDAATLLQCSSTPDSITAQMTALIHNHAIIVVEEQGGRFIALPAAYNAEKNVAEKLALLVKHPPSPYIDSGVLPDLTAHGITLNTEQKNAIRMVLQESVTIITGGPGTGKTTLLGSLLATLDMLRISYKLAAPTGRAARRMHEKTGKSASTLHRLLDFDQTTGSFRNCADHPLTAQCIIIDECSMIDILLAQAVMNALRPGTRLVLIGDSDQLPSVGPGNFLSDCLESSRIPTVRLIEIFRQAEGSMITENAHKIRTGTFPRLTTTPGIHTDFIFIPESNPAELPAYLRKIVTVETQMRGLTAHDVIVLSPMHRGTAGTQILNQFLQKTINPADTISFTYNNTTYKINDRVMQLRNNYDKHVFNGDIGSITHIELEDKTCIVTFDGKQITYLFDETIELTLAYATSIHKSQGSEFPIVVIPLFMQHYMMLRRNLLYTAITRAQKLCIIIGEKRALSIALRPIDPQSQRLTLLKQFIMHTIDTGRGESCD